MGENIYKPDTEKGLVLRICKKPFKTQQSNQKMDKKHKRKFMEEDTYMANKHMKRYPTSVVIREMQIKPIMR